MKAEVVFSDGREAEIEGTKAQIEAAVLEIEGQIKKRVGSPETGAIEAGTAIASGIIAEPISGLAGIAGAVLPGTPGQGAEWVGNTREAITTQPTTETGQRYLQNIGEGVRAIDELPKKVGIDETFSEGLEEFSKFLSERGADGLSMFGETGEAVGHAAGATALPALGAALGARGGAAIPKSPGKVDPRIEAIRRGDADVADLEIGPKGKPRRSKINREAQYQGMEPGMVSAVRAAKPVDKQAMRRMLDIIETGLKNRRAGATLYPSSVAGDSIAKQYAHIAKVNKSAGKRLDGVAQRTLRGVAVDYAPAVDRFLQSLRDLGVKVDDTNLRLNFDGSALAGIGGNEAVIKRIFKWMSAEGIRTDAYGVHQLKRYLDENIEYGKRTEGATRKVQSSIQGLRHDLNEILREASPEYKQVNIEFSETRGVMDEFQSSVGKKINFDGPNLDRALGIEARKILSNYASGTNQLDALESLTAMANKYGGNFGDDIVMQTMFFVQLQKLFPETFRTTFKSEIGAAVEAALKKGPTQAGLDAVIDKGLELAQGSKGEKELLVALKKLLSESPQVSPHKPGLPAPLQ